jgi:uncharacterized surface protein with fasciclin (FAS1) repeats
MRRIAAAGITTLLLAACGQGEPANEGARAGKADSEASVATGAASQDLAAAIGANPRLGGLVAAAGMGPVLSGKAPYTVLAPNDAALDKLPAGSLEELGQPAQRATLTALLRGHILPGTILAADLARAVKSGNGKATIATMSGEPLSITREGEGLRVTSAGGGSARIVGTEQRARNGVVHQIDAVLPAP